MKRFPKAVRRTDHTRARLECFVVLFGLLAPFAIAQDTPKPAVSKASSTRTPDSLSNRAKFTDITSIVNINFEYVASHTSKKYLIETMGSGVALFDFDNDGRLDVFAVNAAPLGDPVQKGRIPERGGPSCGNAVNI